VCNHWIARVLNTIRLYSLDTNDHGMTSMRDPLHIDCDSAQHFTARLFERNGLEPAKAAAVARSLVRAVMAWRWLPGTWTHWPMGRWPARARPR